MSLVLIDRLRFADLLNTFAPQDRKTVIHVLDHRALRLVRFSGEFFNGVRTPTNFDGDLTAIAAYNNGREAKIAELKAEGATKEHIDETVRGPAEIPAPELGAGMWFTIGGDTKYLLTHEDGVWLSWVHDKVLYVSPIARADVKEFSGSVSLKAAVLPTKVFCLIGE